MVDGGHLGRKKHTVHGLIEFDITQARRTIREHNIKMGENLSFTSFFLYCLGQALDSDKQMNAYRTWRNKLVIFNDVDVNMLFEVKVNGINTIRPHIIRAVNTKSINDIQEEIHRFQNTYHSSKESKFIERFVKLPQFIRRLFLWVLFKDPRRIKELYGTILVSSIGMFGSGSGWGIPVPNHTLQLTLGGVSEKPGVIHHKIEIRNYQSVTLSFDHNIVDGAPAARFLNRLRKLIENGYEPVKSPIPN